MMANLTRGAVAMIMDGARKEDDDIKPILQVFRPVMRTFYHRSNTARYRLTLSDGSQLQEATIPTRLNGMVDSGRLRKGSIVQLTEFASTIIQNLKLIAVIDLEIILEKCDIIPVVPRDNNANFTTVIATEYERIPAQSPPANSQAMASRNLQSFSCSLTDDGLFPRQSVIRRYAADVATGPKPKPRADNIANESIDLNGSGSAPVGPSRSDQPGKVGGRSANNMISRLLRLSHGVVPLLTKMRPESVILQLIGPFDWVYKNNLQVSDPFDWVRNNRLFISDGSYMRLAVISPNSNHFDKFEPLQNGTIIRLPGYDFTIIANQWLILLNNFEIVDNDCDIIGEPKLFSGGADGGSTTANGSSPLGPLPSSLTANVQEYIDAISGNDHYQLQDQDPPPFRLHRIPTTENLPSHSSECKCSKHFRH